METVIEKIIGYIVAYFWNNLQFWRILAIVIFLLGLSVLTFRHKISEFLQSEQRQAHDKNIFTQSDSLMNEQQFSEFFDILGTNRYISLQSKQANRFRYFFQAKGNQYLNKKLDNTTKIFVKKLDNLLVFTATHFFVYPDSLQGEDLDQWQLALYPEILHGPSDTLEYKNAKKTERELHEMLDEIIISLHQYRSLVKKILML